MSVDVYGIDGLDLFLNGLDSLYIGLEITTPQSQPKVLVAKPEVQQGISLLSRPWNPLFSVYRPIPARFQYHRGPYLLMPYGK